MSKQITTDINSVIEKSIFDWAMLRYFRRKSNMGQEKHKVFFLNQKRGQVEKLRTVNSEFQIHVS